MPAAVLCWESHPVAMKTPFRFASFLIFCGLAFPYPASASAPPNSSVLPPIVETMEPIFPPDLERDGIATGNVKFVIKVDKTGKLEDLLVTEYTRRQFADEATRAIRKWTFGPTWVGSEPVGWVRELDLYFRAEGTVIRLVNTEPLAVDKQALQGYDETIEYRACSLRDLDRIPIPRHVVAPAGPLRPGSGPVKVEFYIDEEGRVRIPVVREPADAAFANAAVEAVSQWQFEPPTCKGKPVLVHAIQIFTIAPEDPSKK
jgi:TonB family protein